MRRFIWLILMVGLASYKIFSGELLPCRKTDKINNGIIFINEKACPVCFENFSQQNILSIYKCGHMVCQTCFTKLKSYNHDICPLCRTPSSENFQINRLSNNLKFQILPKILLKKVIFFDQEEKLELLLTEFAKNYSEPEFEIFLNGKKGEISPLIYAIKNYNFKAARVLISAGASITKKYQNKSPIELAREKEAHDFVKLIEKMLPPSFLLDSDKYLSKKFWLNYNSSFPAWHCAWYPVQERLPGGAVLHNLYAPDGCLDKHDKWTKKLARSFEFKNNRISYQDNLEYPWIGHRLEASIIPSIFPEPKLTVVRKCPKNGCINYYPHDIEGYLVLIVNNMINVETIGKLEEKNNNITPITPQDFLTFIEKISKNKRQHLILNTNPNDKFQIYPYDKIIITKSYNPPNDITFLNNIPKDKEIYYNIQLISRGYPEQNQTLNCLIVKDENKKILYGEWLRKTHEDFLPHFALRVSPKGDIRNSDFWKLESTSSNPEIDPRFVYDLYWESIPEDIYKNLNFKRLQPYE